MSDRKNFPVYGDLVASRSLVKLSIEPATGRLLDASQAAVDFYGYSREELWSLFVWDLSPDSPPEETLAWLAAVAAGQAPAPRPGERHRLHSGAWREVMVYPDLAGPAGHVSILATIIDVTARKQDELALREAHERFHAFMNNSPAIAWMKDEAGRFVYVNRTWEERFGIRLADVQDKTDAEIWPPECAEQFHRNDRVVTESGRVITTTEEAIDSQGHRSWWSISKFLVTDAAGCRYVGGFGIDISERKQAELHLHHYRQIVEVSTEKLAFLDRDLRYRVVNPAYAALYQSTPEALHGRTVVEVVPPSIWDQGRPHLEAALAGEPQRFQIDVSFPDGHTRSIEVEEQPLWVDGEVQGIIASLHDLTEMRDAQAALVASAAKARAVIDSSPIPLAIAHQTGPVHYLNAAFVQTFGYTLEDLTIWDDWWRQAVPDPAERERVRRERPARAEREGWHREPREVRVRCKDGMNRTVMISTTPLGSEERLYTLYDITDPKRAMAGPAAHGKL